MAVLLKKMNEELTEELSHQVIGKYVHVPTNMHTTPTAEGGEEEVNIWFGGCVAGIEKAVIAFDYEKQEFREEPLTYTNFLLTDGMGYTVNRLHSEIYEITKEEFEQMLADHLATQAAELEAEKKLREAAEEISTNEETM
ncbi:hypothetical protein [Brevibacillus sp. DP1.3A]|jgi:hypothetical protein|uniref:hypothetical protein n=1 Tax=Brevibacillus sp. DP1.3A TaxID=2738867 RepID=UPI00156A984F|nr:hypothetical protein [Brevibacillus sp. DP1.3A]UED74456.1 hypothetical protein HP399_027685 [Brevibacillus sp. DP1.3A]